MTEPRRAAPRTPPRQMTMRFDAVRLRDLSPDERASVVTALATLLREAAGDRTGVAYEQP